MLGLIRQETEFDPYAISSAGRARVDADDAGQRPSSAQAWRGLPYRPDDLLTDTDYNIQLGMIEFVGHLDQLERFAGAGDRRLQCRTQQCAANGWRPMAIPRRRRRSASTGSSRFPFGETRNYVQRVLENTEVYRNRLAGKDMPLQILADLYAPDAPPPALARVKRMRPAPSARGQSRS